MTAKRPSHPVLRIAIFASSFERMLLLIFAFALVGIFLLVLANMPEHRYSFGTHLMLSFLVFVTVGIPFLCFIVPLYAFAQLDNFKWGTREISDRTPVGTERRREKFAYIGVISLLNVALIILAFVSHILLAFYWVFITASLLQLLISTARNVQSTSTVAKYRAGVGLESQVSFEEMRPSTLMSNMIDTQEVLFVDHDGQTTVSNASASKAQSDNCDSPQSSFESLRQCSLIGKSSASDRDAMTDTQEALFVDHDSQTTVTSSTSRSSICLIEARV